MTPFWRRVAQLAVREEQLHAIDDADARAEGVLTLDGAAGATTPRERFAALWDGINGGTAPWATNPRVFRIAFRRVDAPARPDTTTTNDRGTET